MSVCVRGVGGDVGVIAIDVVYNGVGVGSCVGGVAFVMSVCVVWLEWCCCCCCFLLVMVLLFMSMILFALLLVVGVVSYSVCCCCWWW